MRILTFGFLNLNSIPGPAPTPHDVLRASASAGFRSAGLRISGRRVEDECLPIIGNQPAIRELRSIAEDSGMRISSVAAYGQFPETSIDDYKRVFDTIADLGSDLCLMNVYFDDMSAFSDRLAALSDISKDRNIRLGLEFMPFSGLKSIQSTTEVLIASAAENAGYVMDALHIVRSGGTMDDVRAVDAAKIFLAQVCDAKAIGAPRSNDELIDEARNHRAYPGEGEIDLFGFVDALPEGMELEIEVPRIASEPISFERRAAESWRALSDFTASYDTARRTV
jgi:sugar phosphate isomerase/epimerase